MSKYPLIADHGLIGNLQTAALVSMDGTIDWFCAPRFDSPSIFGSLLDHDHGGHFRIRPTVDTFNQQQLYYPDTAILLTRFLTDAGVGEVVDFMPIANPAVASDRHQLVRMFRCIRGEMTFALDIAPRFDYGRESHETHVTETVSSSEVPKARCRSTSFGSRTMPALYMVSKWAPTEICTSRSLWRPGRAAGLSWKRVSLDRCAKSESRKSGSSSRRLLAIGGPG